MSTPDAIADRLAAAAVRSARGGRRPAATYRLQMHAGFTFRDAARLVPYLDALGVSHLYLSPVLTARPGSTHGYDVLDPSALNPEIGTEADFRDLAAAAHDRRMGLVLDVVPNHMALSPANPWWRDVFEHGPSSPFAGSFDIAWDDPPREDLRGRVMLPILGAPYYQVLESGELTLALDGGALVVRLYGQSLPIDPRTYDQVLKPALDRLADAPAEATAELQSILTAVKHLPPRTETDPERIREGRAEAEVVKRRVAALVDRQPAVAAAVAAVLGGYRCAPDCPEACARLDALLDAQAYRLCFWRVASDEINYRRFFDVNELSALSAEREDVFRATHQLPLRLCGEGLVDGLRIDHPDGLFDPRQYLERLQSHFLVARAKHLAATDPEFRGVNWAEVEPAVRERLTQPAAEPDSPKPPPPAGPGQPLYVVVEKILDRSESLPDDWPTAGTTGYDALNAINGLFVDPAGATDLTRAYQAFTGRAEPFGELVFRLKWLVLQSSFSSELDMLARQLDRLARKNRRARDFTLNGLRRALRAVIASFPVYRSYITDHVSPTDAGMVTRAISRARRRSPTLSPELFHFIRDTLLLRPPPAGTATDDYAADQRAFAGKFQQVTAPVTAKGVEDTAFYRYLRLVSVNEVGGDPDRLGWSAADAHRYFADRQARHPGGLTAGATHDTKRGEDTRARIDVLSELAGEWAERSRRWAGLNARHRLELEDGFSAPDPNDEYLLYQTLVGAWPADWDDPAGREAFAGRVKEYMRKAIHEAKEHTSWINPNPEYDAAVQEFVGRVLDPDKSGEFLADLREVAAKVAGFGVYNSLAQTLVRCTAPGVPDTYQGTELWDLSLVDPDNRRPVDYDRRGGLLWELDQGAETARDDVAGFARGLLKHPDGRAKLYVLSRTLRYRRAHPDLFGGGEYLPVAPTGPAADHLFAFARRSADRVVLVVVPRLVVRLTGDPDRPPVGPEVWGETGLPLADGWPGRWANLLTGESVGDPGGRVLAVGQVLAQFPVALLEGR